MPPRGDAPYGDHRLVRRVWPSSSDLWLAAHAATFAWPDMCGLFLGASDGTTSLQKHRSIPVGRAKASLVPLLRPNSQGLLLLPLRVMPLAHPQLW
jgi:hypothetical protein